MNNRNFKVWILMVLCLAALAVFTGCQSGSPLGLEDEALIGSQNVGDKPAPVVSDQPVLPKDASDFQQIDPALQQHLQDIMFNLMHIPLHSGDNNCIDPQGYMYHSGNSFNDGDDVVLKSTFNEMSYVTYGFKDIPEGEEITKIKVYGRMDTQLFNPSGGLYIGVADYDKGQYRWFGPLGTEFEYELPLWNVDTTNDHQRAYITLAVYGGDHYTVECIDVKVGEQLVIPGFLWEEYEMAPFFDPDGFLKPVDMFEAIRNQYPQLINPYAYI